ncbi:MAG TPA: prepilin peptidase [Caulobacteraceae bacterium]|jgi:prepilin peptidase CpaA
MHLIEFVRLAVAAIATVILAGAAVSDIRWRRIPNACILALMALFLPWALTGGWPAALSALEAAVIALAATVALYAFKILGAGDSKLFAACALFAGMELLPFLALGTAVTGGVIALGVLASQPQRLLVIITFRGKAGFSRSVPYGVAIAAAAAIVIWAPLAGLLGPNGFHDPAAVSGHSR